MHYTYHANNDTYHANNDTCHYDRLVKLMTGHGSSIESVVADLFFILCKENREYKVFIPPLSLIIILFMRRINILQFLWLYYKISIEILQCQTNSNNIKICCCSFNCECLQASHFWSTIPQNFSCIQYVQSSIVMWLYKNISFYKSVLL